MSKELSGPRYGFGAPHGAHRERGAGHLALAFYFLGIATPEGVRYLQVHPRTWTGALPQGRRPAGHPDNRAARLRRCSEALRPALVAAAIQAEQRQAELRREAWLEVLARLFFAPGDSPKRQGGGALRPAKLLRPLARWRV